jgi:hypothetical protein
MCIRFDEALRYVDMFLHFNDETTGQLGLEFEETPGGHSQSATLPHAGRAPSKDGTAVAASLQTSMLLRTEERLPRGGFRAIRE